ncbi:MAG: endonuclease/exonuclease/phosphatase family protein [Chlorobiaceae bacterium]|nr:endonuclease/exonuclease/phosphatase family protein [Chlorobiaceae bacterium]NTW74460.1 endonuclease/exonuclease/phosphatase family protein [Chlorobiaceae bacterium]
MHIPRALVLATALALAIPTKSSAGREPREPLLLMWWNVENLFDTRDDPHTADDEFTPQGKLRWTEKKLLLKRIRISTVLKAIVANPEYGKHPDIIALAESENRLVFTGTLSSAVPGGYRVAYHESPDPRGIDIGLAWNPTSVSFTGSRAYRVPLEERSTRDIVAAGFSVSGRPIQVVLNHWPSRSFDVAWSEPGRIAAARVARHIVDSLRARNPKAAIVVMGDFNDPPESRSVREVLGASFDRQAVRKAGFRLLYNCWNDVQEGGSYVYRGKWERIDQILVSSALLDGRGLRLGKRAFAPFLFSHMLDRSGEKLYSTYEKGRYRGGYSDHLPLLLNLGVTD